MENNVKYPWAENNLKLSRAIGSLPLGASEKKIYDEYVKIGGLVIESELPTNSNDMEENNVEKTEEVIVEAPVEEVAAPTEAPEEKKEDAEEVAA